MGIVLMAVVGSAHKHLKNGLRYRVEEVGEAVRLVRVDDAGVERKEPFVMSLAEVARDLRLTHALCYYSCQARTIHGPLRLAQTDSRWFTLRHLIVRAGPRAGGELRGSGVSGAVAASARPWSGKDGAVCRENESSASCL
jgi:hypothetical protein